MRLLRTTGNADTALRRIPTIATIVSLPSLTLPEVATLSLGNATRRLVRGATATTPTIDTRLALHISTDAQLTGAKLMTTTDEPPIAALTLTAIRPADRVSPGMSIVTASVPAELLLDGVLRLGTVVLLVRMTPMRRMSTSLLS